MDDGSPPVLSDDEYRLLADFRKVLRGFFAFSKEAVAEAGLAPQQYQALLAVRAREGQPFSIGDLAQELNIRHHTAVELVDRLEKAALIIRDSGGPGRRIEPRLTAEARVILASLAKVHLAQLKQYAPEIRRLMGGRE